MKYSFADCTLDTESRELSRHGAEVHLSPKAYDLLRFLIEQRPRAVPKQELMNELWQDTFVVEANLHVLIGELRAALGEKSSPARSIKTHHGIGYSFAANVREQRSRSPLGRRARARTVLTAGAKRIPLGVGTHLVGRDRECEVFLNDVSVSREHARIVVTSRSVTVEDLGSKNGTQVNGTRIAKPTAIESGDQITFGSVQMSIELQRGEDPSTLTL
ncbi:MAG: FHA domain-containing protein [Cyanobacteria bacterium]|nr:FHA domain-containing protein [Cyanobacteriota bacterium]